MQGVLFRTVGSLKETGTGNGTGTGTGTGTGNGQELRIQARGLAEIEDRRGNQTLHFVPEARWRIHITSRKSHARVTRGSRKECFPEMWGPLIVTTTSHRDSPGAQDRGSRASWFETRGSRLVIEDHRGNQTLHFVPEARWRI